MADVDHSGAPGKDPTENVRALMEAAMQRQDDLRIAESRRVDEQATIRAEHVREISDLRARYTEQLTIAEAKRIDAIRAVDVNAVAIANERAGTQATVLANQVAASAEALRALVASTAATTSTATAALFSQVMERISTLEKAQYQTQGKTTGIGTSSDVFGRIVTIIIASAAVIIAAISYFGRH